MSRQLSKFFVYIFLFGASLTFVVLAAVVQHADRLPGLATAVRDRLPSEEMPAPSRPPSIAIAAGPDAVALGTNLNGIADWSTQLPFIDAFKSSRPWITQCQRRDPGCRGQWSTGEADRLDLDDRGWVKSLPAPEDPPEYTRVSTLLRHGIPDGRYPGGEYVVLYEGEGTIEYALDAQKNSARSRAGRDIIKVSPSKAGISLAITETDPQGTGNYLRNIRVVPSQFESTFATEIFNPNFLQRLQPFRTLRFMDWMRINNSQQSEWADRPLPDEARYSTKGVPIEIMVELANRLQLDPWFCIPHLATDEYVRKFAEQVKETLDPELAVYIEFSNEVWNWGFQQTRYAHDRGQERWGKEVGNAFMQWYGMRSAQMADVWHQVFSDRGDRVVPILATQAANHGLERAILECPSWVAEGNAPCKDHGFGGYAIAPYFGHSFASEKNVAQVREWLAADRETAKAKLFTHFSDRPLLDGAKQTSLAKMTDHIAYHAGVARQHGWPLYAYEGGQHLVAPTSPEVTELYIEVNRDPRMYGVYREMLQLWQENGGSLFVNFTDIGRPGKSGSWGVLEHVDAETSPKYRALVDFSSQILTEAVDNR